MNEKKLIDLSHTIEEGMITYKGLPAPVICDFWSREQSKAQYEDGSSFLISTIEMSSNTGTYLDSPFHRYEEGKDLSELPLDMISHLEGIVITVDGRQEKAIDVSYFTDVEVKDKAVLVHTSWDQFWRSDTYFENHPYLTEDAAIFLRDQGAKLVGIDSYNIDNTGRNTRPVHSILLKAEIPIVEHLCQLEHLPKQGFLFYAIPPKIKNFGTFPVRACAQVYST